MILLQSLAYDFINFTVHNKSYDGANWVFTAQVQQNNNKVPDDFIAHGIIQQTHPLSIFVYGNDELNTNYNIQLNSSIDMTIEPAKTLSFSLQAKVGKNYISLQSVNFYMQYKPSIPKLYQITPPNYQNQLLSAIQNNVQDLPTMQYVSTSQNGNEASNIFLSVNCGNFNYLTYQKARKTPVQYGQKVCFYQLDGTSFNLLSDPLEVYQKIPIELIYQSNKNAIKQFQNYINNGFVIVIAVTVSLSTIFLIISLIIIIKTFCQSKKQSRASNVVSTKKSKLQTFKTPSHTKPLKPDDVSYILNTKQ